MDTLPMFFVYILQCSKGKYYVGKTHDLFRRMDEHRNGEGSEWTKRYKPIKVERVIETNSLFDEDKYTKEYMAKKGILNVRGAGYSRLKLTDTQVAILVNELRSAANCCLVCGAPDHYAVKCPKAISKKVSKTTVSQPKSDCEKPKTDDNKPANTGAKWTKEADSKLCYDYDHGVSIQELAKRYCRTELAIRSRLAKHGKINMDPNWVKKKS